MLLLLIIVTLTVVAGALILIYQTRRRRLLQTESPRQFKEPPPARSLFEPTAEEIFAREREAAVLLRAKNAEELRQKANEKIDRAREFEKIWAGSPDLKNTGELINLAAESENAQVFSEISQNVIKLWRKNELGNLSADDLAELLNSHFRLLPQQERISGAMFRLKEEIANLRLQSEE